MTKQINNNYKQENGYQLVIGWLYPELMSTYGDRGNIIVLEKRCKWRNIKAIVRKITTNSDLASLKSCDLLVMGGAQDTQQEVVAKDLIKKKIVLKEMVEKGIPGLYICGGFQYLGKYYKTAKGDKLMQLGILNMFTENPGDKRLIGNIAIKTGSIFNNCVIMGFENHGGRTILEKSVKPLGKVIKGFGSNDKASEEGAIYKNSIGTYFHGPILPKNPFIADYLITKALEVKYKKKINLQNLDDSVEENARLEVAKILSITI